MNCKLYLLLTLMQMSRQSDDFSENTTVHILDTSSFKELQIGFVNLEKPYLVMFYAPWCPHCKRLIQTWERLAERFNEKVGVAAIDCTLNGQICEIFVIKGYPTLLYLSKDNLMYNYKGERSYEAISEFIEGDFETILGETIPTTVDTFRLYREYLQQPSMMVQKQILINKIAIGVLIVFTIILIVICIMDVKENRKLDQMEKELKQKQKEFNVISHENKDYDGKLKTE